MQEPSTAKSPRQTDKKAKADKKFTCPYPACDKKYRKPCLLRTHILSHYNIKPFVCSETNCSKSYTQMCHLQRHRLIHNSKNNLIKRQCNYVKKQSSETANCSLTRNVNNKVVTPGGEGNLLNNENHLVTVSVCTGEYNSGVIVDREMLSQVCSVRKFHVTLCADNT